jgi:Peptidase A4 family
MRRMKILATSGAIATVLSGAFATGAASASSLAFTPHVGYGIGTFSGGNWGGYASLGHFTSASAGWTLPSVTCTSTNDLYAAWVGIDGDGSNTVEQTGVAADCSSGSLQWRPWYEMYPRSPVYFSSPAHTGDSISATVTSLGSGKYRLVISDTTAGWSKTFNQSLRGARNASAEAIVESPTDSYPRFAAQNFTNVTFNGTALASESPDSLTADNRGSGSVVPSAIGADGESFHMTQQ